MRYTTPKEEAQRIRETLNNAGIKSKSISIRTDARSISIQVHDLAIDVGTVRSIASIAKQVERCEASGEIMQGGNVFISVQYSERARGPMAVR